MPVLRRHHRHPHKDNLLLNQHRLHIGGPRVRLWHPRSLPRGGRLQLLHIHNLLVNRLRRGHIPRREALCRCPQILHRRLHRTHHLRRRLGRAQVLKDRGNLDQYNPHRQGRAVLSVNPNLNPAKRVRLSVQLPMQRFLLHRLKKPQRRGLTGNDWLGILVQGRAVLVSQLHEEVMAQYPPFHMPLSAGKCFPRNGRV